MCTNTANLTLKTMLDELEHARVTAPDWFALYEDSRLSVCASAEPAVATQLMVHAPTPFLAGLVMGLYLNN